MKRFKTLMLPVLVCLPVAAAGQARHSPVGMASSQAAALNAAEKQDIVAKLASAARPLRLP